jgi:hypothetical protein
MAANHDSDIRTRIVFETSGGLGTKAILDLIRRVDLASVLGSVRPLRDQATSNEVLTITAHERLFHGGERGQGTYLRVSPGRSGGASVRIRSCQVVFSLVRTRLLAEAKALGLVVSQASYSSPSMVNKPGPAGRVAITVRGQDIKVGDMIYGREIVSVSQSFGGTNVPEEEKYTTLAMFADGARARFGFVTRYKIARTA